MTVDLMATLLYTKKRTIIVLLYYPPCTKDV